DHDSGLRVPGYDITATFRVGAIPKGVVWVDLAPHLRSWFRQQAGAFPEGNSIHKVPGLGFKLEVLVEKTPDELLGPSSSFLVMRHLPTDSLQEVVRIALGRKLPKLAGTPADRRVLLLEKA